MHIFLIRKSSVYTLDRTWYKCMDIRIHLEKKSLFVRRCGPIEKQVSCLQWCVVDPILIMLFWDEVFWLLTFWSHLSFGDDFVVSRVITENKRWFLKIRFPWITLWCDCSAVGFFYCFLVKWSLVVRDRFFFIEPSAYCFKNTLFIRTFSLFSNVFGCLNYFDERKGFSISF